MFQQTERARAEYSKDQQLMRQWNAEIVEYEWMKAYYAEQGQEPPYKSLGAFRREARKPREKQSDVFRSMCSRIAEEKSAQKDLTKKRKKNRIIVETNAEIQIRAECAVDWSAINTNVEMGVGKTPELMSLFS